MGIETSVCSKKRLSARCILIAIKQDEVSRDVGSVHDDGNTESIVHWTARPHLNRIINTYKKPVKIKIKKKLHGGKESEILEVQPLNMPQNKNLIEFIFKKKKKKKKKKKGGGGPKKKKKKKKKK